MSQKYNNREYLKQVERVLHFCGVSFYDEVSPQQRFETAEKYLKWILNNKEARSAFEKYNPQSVSLSWTFSTRISGLAIAIANYIAGNSIYDRQFASRLPQLDKNNFYKHDPMFGKYIDSLIGKPDNPPAVFKNNLKERGTIKVADFGCAPKRAGSGDLILLKSLFSSLFPDKKFEFFGYDIDFRTQYPVFNNKGEFIGWEEGYIFDGEGITTVNGDTYYNANNPSFNIVSQREGLHYVNTFDSSHNKYDIIINSAFYSFFEMDGEPRESLDMMLSNLLALRTAEGALFLNTCDDCFKIFPFSNASALQAVIPFISSLENINKKISEILIGGVYCRGVYGSSYMPLESEKEKVRKAIYIAHRLANRDLTFLDRLFETYERINKGSDLNSALSCLTDTCLYIPQGRRAKTRERIYQIKKEMNKT